jgi:integrase
VQDFENYLVVTRKKNGEKHLEKTIDKYAYYVNKYFDEFEILKNNPDELVKCMNEIMNRRRGTVVYNAFKSYLHYCGYDKNHDAFKNLKKPEKTASALTSVRYLQSKVMSRSELKTLFDGVDDETKLIFSMLFDTACRRNELLNMKWGDVVIGKNPTNDGVYGEVTIIGKGYKKRVVYYGKTTHNLLEKLRPMETRFPQKKIFEFYEFDGITPLKKQDDKLYFIIKKNIKRVLGRDLSPHAMRHCKLTQLAENGADILGISKYGGHSSMGTTSIYVHASNKVGRDVFENYSKDMIEEEEK